MNTIMHKVIGFIILGLTFLAMFSCITPGNIFLRNEYPYGVIVYTEYEYQGEIFEKTSFFYIHTLYAPASRGHKEYSHMVFMRIENMQGTILVEYTREYISEIRSVFITGKYQQESWIFTEKGLFLVTDTIRKEFRHDKQKINEYYCSDEAVQDLAEKLRESRTRQIKEE
jgi:hypothetical protein